MRWRTAKPLLRAHPQQPKALCESWALPSLVEETGATVDPSSAGFGELRIASSLASGGGRSRASLRTERIALSRLTQGSGCRRNAGQLVQASVDTGWVRPLPASRSGAI